MIHARVRAGARWSDASILNLSSRGMLMHSAARPTRGAYLEIRRGHHIIVARVVWANADRFGVRTQDVVPADRLMDGAATNMAEDVRPSGADRRAVPRSAFNHDISRWQARAAEYGALLMLGGLAGFVALAAVLEGLAAPLHAAAAVLSR